MAENSRKNVQELWGSAEIGEIFGVGERRIQQLVKEGVITAVKTRPYRFDLLETVRTYITYLSEKANDRERKTADTAKAESDRLRAEADLKQSKAEIEELKLKELKGEMHRSEDVEAVTTDLVFTIRSMIMALPGRLAMDVVKVTTASEASALIRNECYKILNELANYKYDPDVYRRRVREREGWSNEPPDRPGDD